jgi:hypothetical protein
VISTLLTTFSDLLLSFLAATRPKMGRVALESTSAAFQTAANPSQLPTRESKKARWFMTPGLLIPPKGAGDGCASTACGIERTRIRRTRGGSPRVLVTQNKWLTSAVHPTPQTVCGGLEPMGRGRISPRCIMSLTPRQTVDPPRMFAPGRLLFRTQAERLVVARVPATAQASGTLADSCSRSFESDQDS